MKTPILWILAGLFAVSLAVMPFASQAARPAAGGAPAAAPAAVAGAGGVVQVGGGSYLIQGGGKADPIRGPNFKGPCPTEQWFSNLLFKGKDCNNQFPLPLAVKPTGNGLMIHNPGASIGGGAGGIQGNMNDKNPDLVLSGTDGGNYSTVALDGYSDWFIDVAFVNGGKGMHVSYGHGSPFVYATFDSGGAAISCGGNPTVFGQGGSVMGITLGKSSYGLFGPTGSMWVNSGGKITNAGGPGKNYFAVALLPDGTPETLALFKKYAYAHVVDTKVVWKFEAGNMNVTFNFITKPYEGTEKGTISAMLPHQWKYTNAELSPMTKYTYPCVRGTLKVIAGPAFTTSTPIQGILPELPPQGLPDKSRIATYLKDIPRGGGPGDTYGEGKTLGKLASLAGVADAAGDSATAQACISELKRRLEGWFTATPGKGAGVFTYNPSWGILVGQKGSYGSDWPFNDHHFHYGYFIRAAAEVARFDPAWADKWGGMVNIVIRECASPDRQDKLFPFMKCFDKYEGHSWASGDAGFGSGNNEESSSEAMNCWYGMTMWGAATGDIAMRDQGLYQFTTHMTAIEEYWFDVSKTNFPPSYTHECVGMVWGTGGGWGTWFSGDADCIHGINYLPFTPGSVYLIRYPDYIKRASASALSLRKAGANFGAGWGDLHLMFLAGADPATAAKFMDSNPNMNVEGGNSRAFLYHWLNTLNTLGVIDKNITADYPLYNVYNKMGRKTYVIYNSAAKPLTVTFKDGTKVTAQTKGFASVTK